MQGMFQEILSVEKFGLEYVKVGEEMSEEMNAVAVMDKPIEAPQKAAMRNEAGESVNSFDVGTAHFESYVLTPSQRKFLVFKRAADFIISLISLIILAIPFLLIAVIQRIVSPKEPVFFAQNRVGKDGKIIKVAKFRSMKSSAPHDCPTKDFNEGEQYITKWGRFLRDSSIDELPQLFQVLTGERDIIETTKKNVGFSRVVAA